MQSLGIVFGKWVLFLPLFRPQSSLFNVNNSGLNEVFKWQKRILIYWLKLAWGRLAGQGRAKQMRLLGHWRLWRATVEETFISTPHLSVTVKEVQKWPFFLCVTLLLVIGQFCPGTDLPVYQCAFQQVLLKNCLLTSPSELMVTFSSHQNHKHQVVWKHMVSAWPRVAR